MLTSLLAVAATAAETSDQGDGSGVAVVAALFIVGGLLWAAYEHFKPKKYRVQTATRVQRVK